MSEYEPRAENTETTRIQGAIKEKMELVEMLSGKGKALLDQAAELPAQWKKNGRGPEEVVEVKLISTQAKGTEGGYEAVSSVEQEDLALFDRILGFESNPNGVKGKGSTSRIYKGVVAENSPMGQRSLYKETLTGPDGKVVSSRIGYPFEGRIGSYERAKPQK